MMVSPKAVEKAGKEFFNAPVCSGPYKFTERVAQDRIVLDRFAGYRDQAALHFDRVIIRPTPKDRKKLAKLFTRQFPHPGGTKEPPLGRIYRVLGKRRFKDWG